MISAAPSRDGWGRAMVALGSNERTVLLDADLGKSTRSIWFRDAYPERFFCIGIAEQNMMLVAAGLASAGYAAYASTFAIFTERAFEQVRNGIARPNLPVHLCGSHGGVHTGSDGSSAQSIEDLAIFRALPNMTVMHPCDANSAEHLTHQTITLTGPSYMRTCRNASPTIHEDPSSLKIGKGAVLRNGPDVAIVAVGVMVERALAASEVLARAGIQATVVDMHTIKPLDTKLIQSLSKTCGAFVSCEDHSTIGGLGSAMSEEIVRSKPCPLEMIGISDRFGESGPSEKLLDSMGLDVDSIIAAARRAIERRDGV